MDDMGMGDNSQEPEMTITNTSNDLSSDSSDTILNISVNLSMSASNSDLLLQQGSIEGQAMVPMEVLYSLMQEGGIRARLNPEVSALIVSELLRLSESDSNTTSDDEDYVPPSRGLTISQIKRLPAYKYKAKKHKCPQTKCLICLADFKTNQFLRRLPCLHQFHRGCVDKWLKRNKKCPICRWEAVPKYIRAVDIQA
ncbi:NEP1-interacting protein-like 1 [Cimex lectularius]|uniref:RING-type domain-containing protein n=1 Tax=Cimex lectularius TaxID=79782 RepID=A0A8I6SCI5_CIMLE|nr:NEP1-interacting protein-like 1 [Cimex lectularius]